MCSLNKCFDLDPFQIVLMEAGFDSFLDKIINIINVSMKTDISQMILTSASKPTSQENNQLRLELQCWRHSDVITCLNHLGRSTPFDWKP